MLHQQGGCRVFISDIFKGKITLEIAEAKHVRSQPDRNQVLLSPSLLLHMLSARAHQPAFLNMCDTNSAQQCSDCLLHLP